jgi:hypothetical protein
MDGDDTSKTNEQNEESSKDGSKVEESGEKPSTESSK